MHLICTYIVYYHFSTAGDRSHIPDHVRTAYETISEYLNHWSHIPDHVRPAYETISK